MLGYEGDAARIYWKAWTKAVSIPWSSTMNLPAHWLTSFPRRGSGTRVHPSQRRTNVIDRIDTGNRGATDPINAMLNYAYRIAETEAKISCLTHGINPDIGFMHTFGTDRDAMALDLLEVVRPLCDHIVLSIATCDPFDSRWCYESRYGIVRLSAPLTQMIAERSLDMARVIEPHASALASALNEARIPKLRESS
jgi:CRISPR/Cas system-associated endonuclease Cas1